MESRFGVHPRVRIGGFKALDVYVDGRLVYSEKKEGAPASDATILARIQAPGR